MPVLDGWGVANASRRRGHDVPILVITGGLEAPRAVHEMGAIGFLEKPFRLGELLKAVSKLVPEPDGATSAHLLAPIACPP
jgi:FixJ family two-component response regulator